MNRTAWKSLLQLFFLTTTAVWASAEVRIESRPNPLEVHGGDFEAQVDWDGCLTSLRVYGQEFLAANVSISRGTYFFYLGPLQLSEVSQPASDTITARGDLTKIQYSFAEDMITWEVSNHSNVDVVFFTVFAAMDGLQSDESEIVSSPITADSSELTCYRGGVRLQIDGFTKIWGPWQGPHQVGQVDIKPGESKQLRLRFGKATPKEDQELVQLNALPPDSPLTILSPRNHQVFQRNTANEGEILVSGRCSTEVDEIEFRVRGESKDGPLPEQWISMPPLSAISEFNATVPVPAGGWYSLEVRAKNEGKVVAEQRVEQFGVGEVFVGAGQSNSTNSGEFKTQQKSGMVASFSGSHWQIADDPQPGVADSSQGGSFWPAFGDALYEKYRVPIGVATTGYGGTSVNQWKADGHLFNWMMSRVHQLGPRGFRALLWHQGESDVQMSSDEYYEKLRNVIVSSRAKAGWEFPWFVAQATYHNPERLRFEGVRSAQQRLWTDAVALEGPDTDTLTGDHRDLKGLGIHFSPKGLKAHGEMWAELVGAHLDEALSKGQ